eukprot:CAMPEP_0172600200 /NCGR_PEP_ID=MMETSP1068-20121228/20353_1 /TAXON_ID=35684 /ORGANISM="Pseudopedinella elastica, Strain CCMP716" /LENGTH=80 /DNA_ID=CAMNT_0013400749 /DNA_START=817 /DNA_END=1059 /DNA_ORIENTATION=+
MPWMSNNAGIGDDELSRPAASCKSNGKHGSASGWTSSSADASLGTFVAVRYATSKSCSILKHPNNIWKFRKPQLQESAWK